MSVVIRPRTTPNTSVASAQDTSVLSSTRSPADSSRRLCETELLLITTSRDMDFAIHELVALPAINGAVKKVFTGFGEDQLALDKNALRQADDVTAAAKLERGTVGRIDRHHPETIWRAGSQTELRRVERPLLRDHEDINRRHRFVMRKRLLCHARHVMSSIKRVRGHCHSGHGVRGGSRFDENAAVRL